MEISMIQAILLGFCACLASMPGMGGTSFGNYTLGRPLVAGLVVGLILGDIRTGIIVGAARRHRIRRCTGYQLYWYSPCHMRH